MFNGHFTDAITVNQNINLYNNWIFSSGRHIYSLYIPRRFPFAVIHLHFNYYPNFNINITNCTYDIHNLPRIIPNVSFPSLKIAYQIAQIDTVNRDNKYSNQFYDLFNDYHNATNYFWYILLYIFI